jgi:hypothetical protein
MRSTCQYFATAAIVRRPLRTPYCVVRYSTSRGALAMERLAVAMEGIWWMCCSAL